MASVDMVHAATKVGWDRCDVVHELQWNVLGVDQLPVVYDSHELAQRANFLWITSVAAAVSVIRTWLEIKDHSEETLKQMMT